MTPTQETSLTRTNSLDQRLALPKSEKSLSKRECLDLIAHADALRQFDERKDDGSVLGGVEQLPAHRGDYPITVAYEIAQSLGIPASYVERAIDLHYPSADTQLQDIKEHGAVPNHEIIMNTYSRQLTKCLQQHLPQDKIKNKSKSWENRTFIRNLTRQTKRSFLSWQWNKVLRKEIELAELEFYFYTKELKVDLYDPIFLRICGNTLRELNQHFQPQLDSYRVKYHYVVE